MALEARQAEAFRHHALAREGGIAMDQQRHHPAAVAAILVLLGAHLAEHHRIDDLEMRRVGGQRQVTRLSSNSRSEEEPRWYLTSPEPSTSSGVDEPPLNSWKITE